MDRAPVQGKGGIGRWKEMGVIDVRCLRVWKAITIRLEWWLRGYESRLTEDLSSIPAFASGHSQSPVTPSSSLPGGLSQFTEGPDWSCCWGPRVEGIGCAQLWPRQEVPPASAAMCVLHWYSWQVTCEEALAVIRYHCGV